MNIALDDDSAITAKKKHVREVRMQGGDGLVTVSVTDTLLAPDAGMSLLLVSAIAKNDIVVLFLPKKPILFNPKNNNYVLGYAKRADDDLYYINENQDELRFDITNDANIVRAFMGVASRKQSTGYQSPE